MSFEHHEATTKLEPLAARNQWLDTAKQNGWTPGELATGIRNALAIETTVAPINAALTTGVPSDRRDADDTQIWFFVGVPASSDVEELRMTIESGLRATKPGAIHTILEDAVDNSLDEEEAAAVGLRSRRELRWAAMSVLVVSYLLTFVVRYGTAVVLPDLRADLGVGDVALGALAAAYFWPYALVQPVAGMLDDAWGAKLALPIFVAAAAAGTALFAAAPSFPVALLGRALGGAGVGIVYISGIGLVSRWVSAKHFGTAAGLFSASGILGGFVAARPLDSLVSSVGWRASFGIIAALLLACAVIAATVIPARPRTGTGGAQPLRGLTAATRLRNVRLIGVYAFTALGILASMQALWTIPFLTDVYRLDEGRSATVLGALSLGLFAGIPFWGLVADRVLHSQRVAILVSLVIQTSAWALLAVSPSAWPRDLLYPLFLVIGFSNGCWMPAYALVRSTSPPTVQGTASGLLNFAFFSGAALFQQTSGALLGQFTRRGDTLPEAAYQMLFGGFCVALLIASACVAASRKQPYPLATSAIATPVDRN